jgi:NADH-quinone oxidoreductase subunit K
MISIEHYLAFGFMLFVIGAAGALVRRNPIVILMSIELMLIAVTVNLIAFSRLWAAVHGQLFAIFIMADAAAQTALALGIVVAYNSRPRLASAGKDDHAETGQPASDVRPLQPVVSESEEVDSYAERLQP